MSFASARGLHVFERGEVAGKAAPRSIFLIEVQRASAGVGAVDDPDFLVADAGLVRANPAMDVPVIAGQVVPLDRHHAGNHLLVQVRLVLLDGRPVDMNRVDLEGHWPGEVAGRVEQGQHQVVLVGTATDLVGPFVGGVLAIACPCHTATPVLKHSLLLGEEAYTVTALIRARPPVYTDRNCALIISQIQKFVNKLTLL